jgi:hypothetical protein
MKETTGQRYLQANQKALEERLAYLANILSMAYDAMDKAIDQLAENHPARQIIQSFYDSLNEIQEQRVRTNRRAARLIQVAMRGLTIRPDENPEVVAEEMKLMLSA